AVAGLDRQRLDLGALADLLGAQVLPEHVAEAVLAGLGGGDGLVLDQGLGQRVIDGELFDLAVADQVGAAVADAGDVQLAALAPDRQHDGRAHVAQAAVELAHGDDLLVRLDHGAADDGLDLVGGAGPGQALAQLARHHLDGPLAGDLAGRLPAHAVRDDAHGQVGELLDLDGVFVVLAVVAQKGTLADVQRQGHKATSWIAACAPRPRAPAGGCLAPSPGPVGWVTGLPVGSAGRTTTRLSRLHRLRHRRHVTAVRRGTSSLRGTSRENGAGTEMDRLAPGSPARPWAGPPAGDREDRPAVERPRPEPAQTARSGAYCSHATALVGLCQSLARRNSDGPAQL